MDFKERFRHNEKNTEPSSVNHNLHCRLPTQPRIFQVSKPRTCKEQTTAPTAEHRGIWRTITPTVWGSSSTLRLAWITSRLGKACRWNLESENTNTPQGAL
jgi:hypothetical protein